MESGDMLPMCLWTGRGVGSSLVWWPQTNAAKEMISRLRAVNAMLFPMSSQVLKLPSCQARPELCLHVVRLSYIKTRSFKMRDSWACFCSGGGVRDLGVSVAWYHRQTDVSVSPRLGGSPQWWSKAYLKPELSQNSRMEERCLSLVIQEGPFYV